MQWGSLIKCWVCLDALVAVEVGGLRQVPARLELVVQLVQLIPEI